MENGESKEWEAWVYGLISVTIISIISFAGLLTIPCLKTTWRARWMQVFIALAVATLCCDAMLHLIPEALGLHGHGHENGSDNHTHNAMLDHKDTDNYDHETAHSHDASEEEGEHEEESKAYLGTMLFVMFFVYISYTIEFLSRWVFAKGYGHSHAHHSHATTQRVQPAEKPAPVSNSWTKSSSETTVARQDKRGSILDVQFDTFDEQDVLCLGMKPVAWLILIGDAIHNFADGMIIGVAFRKGVYGGTKTSIAVMCHEIPHEVGDFVVLIDSGLSIRRAMVLNVVGSVTAYIGFIIGAVLSEIVDWDKWVFAAAAGVFLYVAWIDMLNHLKEFDNDKDHWSIKLTLQNIGFMLGATIIFLIGYFEDELKGA